jgi:hypothetical protein
LWRECEGRGKVVDVLLSHEWYKANTDKAGCCIDE